MRFINGLMVVLIVSLLSTGNVFAGGCLKGDDSKRMCVEMPKGAFPLENERAMCSKSGSTYVETCTPAKPYCLMDNGPQGKIYLWGSKIKKSRCRGVWHESE